MNCAVVDLGSNTIRLSVYSVDEHKRFFPLFSEKITAGLAGYIDDGGELSKEGIIQAIAAIEEFSQVLEHIHLDSYDIFATASLRNIKNTLEAVESITMATGKEIDVITGEEEAELSFYGAIAEKKFGSGIMFDSGGASTEVVHFKDGEIVSAESVELGCLTLFSRYVSGFIPTREELLRMQEHVREAFSHIRCNNSSPLLLGVGGSVRALQKIIRPQENYSISVEKLTETIDRLTQDREWARRKLLRRCPERVHTLIPGAVIIRELAQRFNSSELYVSGYGVREGYLCRRVLAARG